jgi:hypothetical protein
MIGVVAIFVLVQLSFAFSTKNTTEGPIAVDWTYIYEEGKQSQVDKELKDWIEYYR